VLQAEVSGRHTFKLQNSGVARLYLDGKLVLESDGTAATGFPPPQAQAEIELDAGRSYDLKIEFLRPEQTRHPVIYVRFAYTPRPEEDDRQARAVAAAQAADLALVFAGWPVGYESEGFDRPGISLTGRQDELIRAVAAANPRTVVVLNCGSPVAMPWVDDVAAIVEAYYPGQENGNAVANLLLGDVNPSGKLTVTFPKRIEDTPAYTNFGPGREVYYGEGVFVGYRHYDQRQVEPLFPFGHGLSYTTFDYRDLAVSLQPGPAGETPAAHVLLTVVNEGDRAGAEIVQVYVRDVDASLPRPPKELKAFTKVHLQPGESKQVEITLGARAFAFYEPTKEDWVVEPGEFEILVGASSRDIRLRKTIDLS
jgi:beta-glucosidase